MSPPLTPHLPALPPLVPSHRQHPLNQPSPPKKATNSEQNTKQQNGTNTTNTIAHKQLAKQGKGKQDIYISPLGFPGDGDATGGGWAHPHPHPTPTPHPAPIPTPTAPSAARLADTSLLEAQQVHLRLDDLARYSPVSGFASHQKNHRSGRAIFPLVHCPCLLMEFTIVQPQNLGDPLPGATSRADLFMFV